MTLNLQINNHSLNANLVVENEVIRNLLQTELDHLKQELQRQGIQIENFSIKTRSLDWIAENLKESGEADVNSESSFSGTQHDSNQEELEKEKIESRKSYEKNVSSKEAEFLNKDYEINLYTELSDYEFGSSQRSISLNI